MIRQLIQARKMVTLMKWIRNNINNTDKSTGNLAAGKNAILAALLSLAFLMMPTAARAQAWSGLLDPSRAIDWRQVGGVTFTIPSGGWSQCTTAACNTVTSAGTIATAAQINAAIASAPANTFVKLGSGIFTLTSCLSWAGHSHVVLRGNGPTNTILKFTGSCFSGFLDNTILQFPAP